MTVRPYELLVRFAKDGSVAGASVRTITTVNGRDYEGDPSALTVDDPMFSAFANQFSAAIAAERDNLAARITELEAIIAKLKLPFDPRKITVDAFLNRLTPASMLMLFSDTDPVVQGIASMLVQWKENSWPIFLDSKQFTQSMAYLAASGKISADRIAVITSDASREESPPIQVE